MYCAGATDKEPKKVTKMEDGKTDRKEGRSNKR